ncbi:MAG: class I SAM-dependent methyltransferase [Myxococcota bacterium]
MVGSRRLSTQRNGRPLDFFKGFLRNPKEVGSVIPSSRFLTRRVLQCGRVDRARVIVELGPGTGVLTGEILRRMRANARLVAVEINPRFVRLLRRSFPDPRLTLHEGSSEELEKALLQADATEADLVVSGIPFSTLARPTRRATLEAARRVLGPGGRFVAYQFRGHVRRFAEPFFGPGDIQREFLNLPPMRVYVWQKGAAFA